MRECNEAAEKAEKQKVENFRSIKDELEAKRLQRLAAKQKFQDEEEKLCRTPPMMREMDLREKELKRNSKLKNLSTSANNFRKVEAANISLAMAKTVRDSAEPKLGDPFIMRLQDKSREELKA